MYVTAMCSIDTDAKQTTPFPAVLVDAEEGVDGDAMVDLAVQIKA
jgi:hypothetical protein